MGVGSKSNLDPIRNTRDEWKLFFEEGLLICCKSSSIDGCCKREKGVKEVGDFEKGAIMSVGGEPNSSLVGNKMDEWKLLMRRA